MVLCVGISGVGLVLLVLLVCFKILFGRWEELYYFGYVSGFFGIKVIIF